MSPMFRFAGLGLLAIVIGCLETVAILDNKFEPVVALPFAFETRTPAPPKEVVPLVGDSFTAGAGSTDTSLRWITRSATAM
jgi:hypothetical protein